MNCTHTTRKKAGVLKFFLVVAFMAVPGIWGCGEESEDTDLNVLPFLTSDDDGHTHVVYLPYADVYGPKVGGVILETSEEQDHTHEVQIRQEELLALISGGQVVRPTSHTLGHQHHVLLSLGPVKIDAEATEAPASDAGIPDVGPWGADAGAPDADVADTASEADAAPEPVSACGGCGAQRID